MYTHDIYIYIYIYIYICIYIERDMCIYREIRIHVNRYMYMYIGVLILLNVLLGGVEMDADVRLAFEFPPGVICVYCYFCFYY